MKYKIKLLFLLTLIVLQVVSSEYLNDEYYYEDYDEQAKNTVRQSITCYPINHILINCSCTFSKLQYTATIDCSYTNLSLLPENLNLSLIMDESNTSKLKIHLLFENNLIKTLTPIRFTNNTNGASISVLSLSNNQINSISYDAFETISSSLESLMLDANEDITSFSKISLNSQINFTSLRVLKLNNIKSKNVKFKLDDSLFTNEKFINLQYLDLSGTRVNFNEDKLYFGNLQNLEYLNLNSNGLEKIPCKALRNLKNLKTIKLSSNNLTEANEESHNCFEGLNLSVLDISYNNFNDEKLNNLFFGKSLGNSLLEHLESLNVKNNVLKKFSSIILPRLNNLKKLSAKLDYVELHEIPFKKLKFGSIFSLDLSDSELKNLQKNIFSSFGNLKYLLLRNCSIEFIDEDTFSDLQYLNYLDLSNNMLKSFSVNFNLSKLNGGLDLQHNNFICNCSMNWMVPPLISFSLVSDLTCKLHGNKINLFSKSYQDDCLKSNHTHLSKTRIILYTTSVFMVISGIALIVFFYFRGKYVNDRNRQYRYRFFNQQFNDEAFENMQDTSIYQDTTLTLKISEPDSIN